VVTQQECNAGLIDCGYGALGALAGGVLGAAIGALIGSALPKWQLRVP
jgi:hypothetical protein